MLEVLKKIKNVDDLKQIPREELPLVAKDIRSFLVQSIAQTGGHLASNLGIVELTIAMHYVFDSPTDAFVWDVGHQAYVHKILTGRRRHFKTLRQFEGMSGFPKREESEHDIFETGHSSTSISAAMGLAVGRDLKGEKNHVVAVIGDGALTGGMAFEALNNAGRGNTNIIVILNDNEMSIAENVGGMGRYLNKLRSKKAYVNAKEDVQDLLGSVPIIGNGLVETVRRTKDSVKTLIVERTFFEELGLHYIGPIDGHDLDELVEMLTNAKALTGPVLIHVKTKKGKGYQKAEAHPSAYHGVSPFNIKEGVVSKMGGQLTFSKAFGDAMVDLGQFNKEIVAISAAMGEGTGLVPFEKAYPERFFDVGIAEQHAVTFAAGLAVKGLKPIVAIYSSFLQRAYDQIVHDVALQKLPVIFCVDRAGLVGEDGSTHQGVFDIAFLGHIPHMTLLAPKMPEEMEAALACALKINGPVAIRYPRGGTVIDKVYQNNYRDLNIKVLESGREIALLATGKAVSWALDLREALAKEGIEVAVVEVPCITPLDQEGLLKISEQYQMLFTLEDHITTNGFGMHIIQFLAKVQSQTPCYQFGYEQGIVQHGAVGKLLESEKMSIEQLKNRVIAYKEKASI